MIQPEIYLLHHNLQANSSVFQFIFSCFTSQLSLFFLAINFLEICSIVLGEISIQEVLCLPTLVSRPLLSSKDCQWLYHRESDVHFCLKFICQNISRKVLPWMHQSYDMNIQGILWDIALLLFLIFWLVNYFECQQLESKYQRLHQTFIFWN